MVIFDTIFNMSRPQFPVNGDAYIDPVTGQHFEFDGSNWCVLSVKGVCFDELLDPDNTPTEEELSTFPTLKTAWEEYMIIRKLLGLPCR